MKLGIVTFHTANNYGAVLQCYALAETLKELGQQVELVDLPLHKAPSKLRARLRLKLLSMAFSEFREKFLPNIVAPTTILDSYYFGSDQVWNPQITAENYELFFGSFVPKDKPKVAYAASFGLSTWKFPVYTNTVTELLASFKALGVRESSAVDICQNEFNVGATQVVDPTLLRADYNEVFKKRKPTNSLVCYIFGKDDKKMESLRNIAAKLKLNAVLMNDFRLRKKIKSVPFPSVATWLSHLEASNFVITDSFHCMVFAIIFKKNFIAIPAIPERAGRMTSLLESLGLSHRYFEKIEDFLGSDEITKDIDYKEVDQKLQPLRKASIQFIQNSLKS
jgi:hypothetical protein